ncbi:MAG: hypothetical protein HKL87_09490 [Acidimicrobiaceae bacterium]|nr:hypothetical protein [Acidimicrobiaceae bacterium]
MSPDYRDFRPDPADAVLLRTRRQTIVWYLRVSWRPALSVAIVIAGAWLWVKFGHQMVNTHHAVRGRKP